VKEKILVTADDRFAVGSACGRRSLPVKYAVICKQQDDLLLLAVFIER